MPVLPVVPSMMVPPGLSRAAFFGVVNHGDADTVFHRAARIGVVGFDENLRLQALIDAIQAHQRRAANGFEDVVTEHKFSGGLSPARTSRWGCAIILSV